MKKIILITATLCFLFSCNPEAERYRVQWEKYRTLWYRDLNNKAFFDSSRKYGNLYFQAKGWRQESSVDTIPLSELK